jgi:hypothetical protein
MHNLMHNFVDPAPHGTYAPAFEQRRPRMAAPDIDRVKRVMESREPTLYEIQAGGWEGWKRSSEYGRCRRLGTRASIVWERATDLAIEAYSADPTVKVLHHYDTYSYIFDDEVLGRFKKGNEDGLTANYPTPLNLAYHENDLDLFGYHELDRVEFVYKLNRFQTEIIGAFVVGRDGDDIAWSYEMRRGRGAKVFDFRRAPLLPPGTSGEIATVRPEELPKKSDTEPDVDE